MKVTIDRINYVPETPQINDKSLLSALNIRFDSDAGDNLTIREYFYKLLKTLWEEGDGFSGKRPFGNSGWQYDLYAPLVKHGYVDGILDENGYVDEIKTNNADEYISKLIEAAFFNA